MPKQFKLGAASRVNVNCQGVGPRDRGASTARHSLGNAKEQKVKYDEDKRSNRGFSEKKEVKCEEEKKPNLSFPQRLMSEDVMRDVKNAANFLSQKLPGISTSAAQRAANYAFHNHAMKAPDMVTNYLKAPFSFSDLS